MMVKMPERYCMWCIHSKNHFDCDTFELLDSYCTLYGDFKNPYECSGYIDATKIKHVFFASGGE